MLLCLKLALVALLSGIAVEGYGLRYSHRRRGSHGREHFQLESLGRNGPHHDYSSNGKHGHFHFYKHPYYRRKTVLEELRSQWSYSEESSESDSGYSSEIKEFDSSENNDWYMPNRHPCRLWRYRTQDTNQEYHTSWTTPPSSRKTTLELPSMTPTKKWNSIPLLESSPQSEPVTTPISIPDVTMPPKTEFIMSRLAPIEEVSVLLTTATPKISQNTMSSPETSPTTMSSSDISPSTISSQETTTVSQAILDCIDNCISTPEFNPVCGTNDETYGNIGKLFCAKSCGIDVELRRMSRCWPLLPFADDYDDDEDNDNSTDRDGDSRGNIGDDGNVDDYTDESDNSGERLPPSSDNPSPLPHFEQSPPHFNIPIPIPLTNDPSTSPDDEPSSLPLNSLSSDPSLSLFSDSSPSPSTKSLLSDDKISPPLGGNGNVVVTTGSINFVSSSTTPSAPRFRRTTHLSELQKCMKLCPVTTAYYPICGTDLVTYINIDRIECARRCGLEVQILCEQPCHLCNVGRQTLASSTKTSLITTSLTTTSTTPTTPVTVHAATIRRNVDNAAPTTLIEQCVKSCPVTPEYNPVCGTNNVNYMNPVQLLCVQMCGDDVKIATFGPCPSETQPVTTEQDEEEVTLSPEVIECTKSCVSTSEYNPVCGTNEETYTNPGKLECAKFCGIDVKLSYKGFCNGFFFSGFLSDNPAIERGLGGQATASREILRPTSLSTRLPLRTSTLTSVETIPTMQSTKSTTPWFLPLVYSPPPSSTFVNNPSTTASTPITTTSESFNSTSYTLGPDVLISIFGNANLKTTSDMTRKKDKVRIDPRFGNEDNNGASQKENLDPNRIVFPE